MDSMILADVITNSSRITKEETSNNVWFMSIAAASLIGLTGVLPILLIPVNQIGNESKLYNMFFNYSFTSHLFF